jgi:(p)ppGpp synthase/HD superfamily hydrolase
MRVLAETVEKLLQAASFAGRAHEGQKRKDGKTPYAAHVFRVCLIVRHVFDIDDPAVLTTALLHDTIEDTTTDADDVIESFGADVADWVGKLSKDKRLCDEEREAKYCDALSGSSWHVKVVKLADILDNLTDSRGLTAAQRSRTVERAKRYLGALDTPDLPPEARRAFQTVARLLADVARQ